ncbi:hypothetical protein [Streptomyces sp. NPDC004528]|uniref:hypothetical protein n=1 Tax=Streptomyces sp. NPDC004528 TaxID=3154550 RepID=UPI0033B29EB4
MPDERPFFVIGQWSGPDIEVWQILEAPDDPDERDDAHAEYSLDAEEVFGSVEVVYATSAGQAEAIARQDAVETAERTGRDLKRQREQRANAAPRRRRKIPHHYV